MKTIVKTLFLTACLATHAFAFDWKSDVRSGDFTSESHQGDDNNIRKENDSVTYIQNDNWIGYQNFDFGSGVKYMWIEGASPGTGGTVELRLGSATGALVGSVAITNTGSWDSYKPFGLKFTQPISGVQNLYLKCVGGTGYLLNLRKFRFQQLAPDYKPPGAIADWVKRTPTKTYQAGSFTSESHPSDNDIVRWQNNEIGYIKNGSWVGYQGFDFGVGANFLTLQATTGTAGGTVEVRVGHPTNGLPIGSINISNTGGWGIYQHFSTDLPQTLTGVQDLYFRFVGNDGWLFDIRNFSFQLAEPGLKSTGKWIASNQFDQESNPAGAPVVVGSDGISELSDGSWVSYGNFNFGQGANLITVTAATLNKGGKMEIRLNSPSGPRISTLDVTHTGSWTFFREYTSKLSQTVTGVHDVYVKFVDANNQGGSLFNLKNLIFENQSAIPASPSYEGTLTVYDPVTGLAPSPYYTYSVQKVSALNAPLKQNSTNWLSPFAWFTECKTGSDPYSTAYYHQEIGGWSHTYCNFELGKNTPIVVKITRNNVSGAPSGPIFMANAHPAHKVESCEVINGEVYVTMREPALVTVDIDGQMDTRDAPMSGNVNMPIFKPYASKQLGSHAVSIFANPVIPDKPVIGAPGVRYINPGDPLPAYNDSSWTTLYFGKGVHHFSRNPDGSPGIWKNGDAYVLMSNKSCYISGDAMVYGNFDGRAEGSAKDNVRVFGYGTLSGAKMPHWDDPYWDEPAQAGTNYLDRPISLSTGYGCRFEGITLADPANHGIAFESGGGNSRRWIKQVSWRANSDMGGIPGVTEDCFFRLQDDGPYVTDYDFRRNTLWFDCNGSPFRGTFMLRGAYGAGHQTVMEDCDIIYVRANWGGSVFEAYDYWEIATYPDGTKNTAQHVVFRNIRVTDPRPSRTLFGLNVPGGATSGLAGMRFENIEYRHPHTWGSLNTFNGASAGPSHHCYFDGVFINGAKLDAPLFANPAVFQNSNVSDMVFRDLPDTTPTTASLAISAANGLVSLNPPGGIYILGTVITVSATPNSGYGFSSWSGDLTGTSRSTTITMNGNKSATATFTLLGPTDTTGSTVDAPRELVAGNTYFGNGFLTAFAGPDIALLGGPVFGMSGGLITINSGAKVISYNNGTSWNNNLADMRLNGVLDLWDNVNEARMDALDGTGSIEYGYPWSDRMWIHVGLDNGSGTFSGTVQGVHYTGNGVQLIKSGTGTQTFDNLANQPFKSIRINAGAVKLATDSGVNLATHISGGGNLIKSGAGLLTLTGTLSYTGNTTIENGTFSTAQPAFADSSTLTLGLVGASPAVLHLPTPGTDIVAQLIIDGVTQPGGGAVYDSLNSGGAITGSGKIQVGIPPNYNLATNSTNGSVSLNPPGGVYTQGTIVTLTATANSGYRFGSWSGDLAGTSNPVTVTMAGNRSITANFIPVAPMLLVVNNSSSLGTADAAIRSRLQGFGYSVQVVSASASTTASATGKSLIIISSSVSANQVTTKFQNVTTPVINWETALQDEFRFTTQANQGASAPQTALNIVASGHPLAAGLAGVLPVATAADSGGFSWGEPAGSPIIIARLNDGSNHPCIYAYETGSAMISGTAPARRVHLFLQNSTFTTLNADGLKLFDAAVNWGMGLAAPSPQGTSLFVAPSDFSTWISANGVGDGPDDDDDKDGLSNREEYAFGLSPTNGSSVNPIAIPLSTTTGTFSYTRRNSALAAPLSYTVWYSTSLEAGNWTEDTGAVEGTPVLVGEVETVPVTISNSLLSNPTLFIQVRAE